MKTSAAIIAVMSSLEGAIGAAGVLVTALQAGTGAEGEVGGAILALTAAAIGFAGAALVGSRPAVAAVLMLAAAVAGIIGTLAFLVPGALLLFAAAQAFQSREGAIAREVRVTR